jgi:transposase
MGPFDLTPTEQALVQRLAASTDQARLLRRAQALSWLARGDAPCDVADRLGVSRQTLYNWAARFRHRRGLDPEARLGDGPRRGRPPTARGVIDPLLLAVIDGDPRAWGYHATAWTAPLLRLYLHGRHGLRVSPDSVRDALDRLGFRWKRPRHALARRSATWRQAKGA